MLYGDGHIAGRRGAERDGKWRVELCEGDYLVIRRYARLTFQLFNLKPIIRKRGNWWDAYYCSRIAYEYLTTVTQHPDGRKTGTLSIPKIARDDAKTSKGFLCGLFSVEGSVKIGRYPRIAIEMLEPKLIQQVAQLLTSFGFHPHTYSYPKAGKTMYGAFLYGLVEARRFLWSIGLVGRKRRKLVRLLSQVATASSARLQPGGGTICRM